MSSALPSDPPSSRAWWSLSPKPSSQELRKTSTPEKASKSSGFNIIATAMGFKSKKHQGIPDPPALIFPTTRSAPDDMRYDGSPSKSSTRTRVDSLEPRTPLDGQRDGRQSLFTVSDVDPFAVRGLFPGPSTSLGSNHLSFYSEPSIPEIHSKRVEPLIFNRVSYVSSPSHSNNHSGEVSPLGPTGVGSKKLKSRRSIGSLCSKQSVTQDESLEVAWESLTNNNRDAKFKSGSFGPLTDVSHLSQPGPALTPRSPMRARGMTDSWATQRSGFLSSDALPPKATQVTSSRVIIRQPSVSRTGMPPSTPPKQELPPPPQLSSASSTSLSSLSFASSNREPLFDQTSSPWPSEKKLETDIDGSSNTLPKSLQPSSAPRNLKKALSYQSLGRRTLSSNNPIPALPPEPMPEMVPRKPHSFHQPKLTIQSTPFSTRHSNSTGTNMPSGDSLPIIEQRRGSASIISLPSRKRLFSSSSNRPSTSQSILSDDDDRSVFSVRSDSNQTTGSSFFRPWTQPLSPALSPTPVPSIWDEPIHESLLSSPSLRQEYVPQQILSPDELEASVEESDIPVRRRGLSILSASTMISSNGEDESISGDQVSKFPARSNATSSDPTGRRSSLLTKGLASPLRLPRRPSTSQANMGVPSTTDLTAIKPSLPAHIMTSLPPPPRQLQSKPLVVASQQMNEPYGITPLPPPPRRQKMSVEKALHHRSLMRKPSFLDIDDESEDGDTGIEVGDSAGGSFLDFARESFDTVRTLGE